MYCNAPTVAYRLVKESDEKNKPIKFIRFVSDDRCADAFLNPPAGCESLLLPCGKCLLCTRRYRFQWALRCLHELRFYDEACFLTLTVNDDHLDRLFPRLFRDYNTVDRDLDGLPPRRVYSSFNSLTYQPFSSFMKRLRRRLEYGVKCGSTVYHGQPPVRFYMCGEYGDHTHRPHYHAILFGFNPPDRKPLISNPNLFLSHLISSLWPYGFHTVAKVTLETISYVAGYCDKKLDNARMAWVDNMVAPEFVQMSRRGGIGSRYFEKYADDLYPLGSDGVLARPYALLRGNRKVAMPKYYDGLLALRNPEKFDKIVAQRKVGASEAEFDIRDWLDECHRRHDCRQAVRRLRDPSRTSPCG